MIENWNRAKVFLRGALVAVVVAGAGIAGVVGVSSIFSSREDPPPDRQKQQAESVRFGAEE